MLSPPGDALRMIARLGGMIRQRFDGALVALQQPGSLGRVLSQIGDLEAYLPVPEQRAAWDALFGQFVFKRDA